MLFFHLVPEIVGANKYFDISRSEIVRALQGSGHFKSISEHAVNSNSSVRLRLNIQCQKEYPESWTISLKLHERRIDGIDFQFVYTDKEGNRYRGWHRNTWDEQQGTGIDP